MRLNHNKVMELRTLYSADAVLERVQGLSKGNLLVSNFVHTENYTARWLLKNYQSQILLAKLKPKSFSKGLHTFFVKMTQRIREKNAYQEFFAFCSYLYGALATEVQDNVIRNALFAYNNLLIQQAQYLAPKDRVIFGVTSQGQPLITKELYPKIDWPVHISTVKYDNRLTFERGKKYLAKYGYSYIQTPEDLVRHTLDEQMVTNMLFQTASYIDETNQDMLPEPYYLPAEGPKMFLWPISPKEYYSRLKTRRYLLPTKGVLAKYKNTGDIKEILFREKFAGGNKIILLCKIRFQNDRFMLAFYDNELALLYTPWRDSSGKEKYHLPLEGLILDSYLNLTQESVDVSNLIVVNDLSADISEDKPAVQFFSYQTKQGSAREDTICVPLDKSQYAAVISEIGPFIRRLPFGAKASEEAKARAKEFGILLGEGETFVRPHKKTVYRTTDTDTMEGS